MSLCLVVEETDQHHQDIELLQPIHECPSSSTTIICSFFGSVASTTSTKTTHNTTKDSDSKRKPVMTMIDPESKEELSSKSHNKSEELPRLMHASLNRIPMQVRFGLVGFLGNWLFLYLYNTAVLNFEDHFPASTIYSIVYFFYIPLGHLLNSLLVFGWPSKSYIGSLLSNYPIGITAIMLGASCTAYLDRIGFEDIAVEWIRQHMDASPESPNTEEDRGEYYSSLLVMIITSAWTYVLSVFVNTPSSGSPEKKDL